MTMIAIRKQLDNLEPKDGCIAIADIRQIFGVNQGSGTVNSIADACHERGIIQMLGYRGNRKYVGEVGIKFSNGRKRVSVLDAGVLAGVLFERCYEVRQIKKQRDVRRIMQKKGCK